MNDEGLTRINSLGQAANEVEETESWQFLAGRRDEETYSFWVVSNGEVPIVETSSFTGIEDNLTIERDPGDSFSKFHVIRFVGDLVGLEIFVTYLKTDLDGISEGQNDPIGDFRQRNPFWALGVLGQRDS